MSETEERTPEEEAQYQHGYAEAKYKLANQERESGKRSAAIRAQRVLELRAVGAWDQGFDQACREYLEANQ